MEINGILYFRRQAVEWKYPDLIYGKKDDFWIGNMDRNPKSKTYGQEKFDWNTELYPKPTEQNMIDWYNEFKYLESRKYEDIREQLDRLTHDIEAGFFGEDAKSGEFYIGNLAVKNDSLKV